MVFHIPLPFPAYNEVETFYNTAQRRVQDNTNFICVPFAAQFVPLKAPLKKLGFNLAFQWSSTMERRLIKNSPMALSPSVYKISCRCGSFYIGQTGKMIEQRAREHFLAFSRNEENSSFTIHYKSCTLGFLWQSPTQLFRISNHVERNMLENALINYSWNDNFNSFCPSNVNAMLVSIIAFQNSFNKIC